MAKIHIGRKIKEAFKASRLKGTEFAKAINKDRQVIYDIFERETIDTGLLRKIGEVLKHDFFSYYRLDHSPNLSEKNPNYGYASQTDVDHLTDLVKKLAVEVQKLHEKLPAKKIAKKIRAKK